MSAPKKAKKPKPDTIWTLPDALWDIIEFLLAQAYPTKATGRPRVDLCRVFNGIIHRMRSGCPWNHLPKELGSDRTIHRWFQHFSQDGFLGRLWAELAAICD